MGPYRARPSRRQHCPLPVRSKIGPISSMLPVRLCLLKTPLSALYYDLARDSDCTKNRRPCRRHGLPLINRDHQTSSFLRPTIGHECTLDLT